MQVLREISSQTAESTAATSSSIGKLAELAAQLRKSVAGLPPADRAAVPALNQARVEATLRGAAEGARPGPTRSRNCAERRRSSG